MISTKTSILTNRQRSLSRKIHHTCSSPELGAHPQPKGAAYALPTPIGASVLSKSIKKTKSLHAASISTFAKAY